MSLTAPGHHYQRRYYNIEYGRFNHVIIWYSAMPRTVVSYSHSKRIERNQWEDFMATCCAVGPGCTYTVEASCDREEREKEQSDTNTLLRGDMKHARTVVQ